MKSFLMETTLKCKSLISLNMAQTFSHKNYYKPTPAKLIKLALAIKGFIGSISVGTFISGNEKLAFVMLVIGAITNEVINFFSDESPS